MKTTKHNHSLTEWLKFIIFSIVMLAPVLAVAIRCMYVVINKNAYINYSGRQHDEYTQIQAQNMQLDTQYHWANSLIPNTTYSGQPTDFYMKDVNNIIGATQNIASARRMRVYRNGTNYMYLAFYDDTDQSITYVNGQTTAISFNFTLTGMTGTTTNDAINSFQYFYTIQNSQYNYLDNVFYSSIDELKENTIFSWAENTGVYTAISTMTNGLEITETAIPLLLSYWTMITVVYVVFDIIINTFTMLTHMISEKTPN